MGLPLSRPPLYNKQIKQRTIIDPPSSSWVSWALEHPPVILVAREPLTRNHDTYDTSRAGGVDCGLFDSRWRRLQSGLIINYPHRWRGMRVRCVLFGTPFSKISTSGTDVFVLGRGILGWVGFREIWMGRCELFGWNRGCWMLFICFSLVFCGKY